MANLVIKCPPSVFADDTKLSDAGDTPEGWEGIQRALDQLEKWDHGNPMQFNKTKCWCWAWAIPGSSTDWEITESSTAEKGLEVLLDERLAGYSLDPHNLIFHRLSGVDILSTQYSNPSSFPVRENLFEEGSRPWESLETDDPGSWGICNLEYALSGGTMHA
ncbi:hypothetical protein DUI87_15739 [Hirundo rustica rustica]|uniref:Reverse transcriptase domain-containing protein n=1 Tax=Hirundo rustica rustica TaxID=333673 RepID=A0A3M0K029_HIRRU|nr:hypothetical protein DUI87_15739 [Hirundo rustica rustica]